MATTAAGVLLVVLEQSTKDLENKGYVEIPPGGRHQFGKMSLSLWRQGHCVRHRSFPDRMEIITDEVFMRPIFSGATDNSNLDHTIQFWIDKFGFENEKTTAIPPPADMDGSWGDVNAALVATSGASKGSKDTNAPMPVPTVAPTMAPTETFVCDLCGNGQSLINLNTRVFIPGPGFLTCGAVAEASRNAEISVDEFPLLAQYLTACGCPPPFNPDEIIPSPVPVDANELMSDQLSEIEARIEAQTAALEMHLGDLDEKLHDWADLILDTLESMKKKNTKSLSDGKKLNLKFTLTHHCK